MNANIITYYNIVENFWFQIFYLTGFMENAKRFNYKFKITKELPVILYDSIKEKRWSNILFTICLFKVRLNSDEFYFCIDTRESIESDFKKGNGFYLPLLKHVKYYFKTNYNKEKIDADPTLADYKNKILSILPHTALRINLFKYRFLFSPQKFNLSIITKDKESN